MPYPGGCSNTTKIDTIDTVVDGIETHVHSTESKVDIIDTNVDNLAPLYGNVSVAPHLAAGVDVTSGSGAWTLGAASATIFTASANTIVEVHIYGATADKSYHLELYAGGVECGEKVFDSDVDTAFNLIMRSQKLTGAITAKLATLSGVGTETCKVKLSYV